MYRPKMHHSPCELPDGVDVWVEYCRVCDKETLHYDQRLERIVTDDGRIDVFFVTRCSGREHHGFD